MNIVLFCFFFFQAEDGIRDTSVTGVQTCALPISKSLQRPRGARHADHRHVQLIPDGHCVERGEYLLEREIARRPEEYQRVRSVRIHAPALFSTCPPNSERIAERSRFWKSASPRDVNRPNRAAARTLAGTASSIAASRVHRPSPESETRPAKRSSAGTLVSDATGRSSSQEAITLPRRHTSVMSARSKSYR